MGIVFFNVKNLVDAGVGHRLGFPNDSKVVIRVHGRSAIISTLLEDTDFTIGIEIFNFSNFIFEISIGILILDSICKYYILNFWIFGQTVQW